MNIPESNAQVELFVVDTSGSELYADMRSHYVSNGTSVEGREALGVSAVGRANSGKCDCGSLMYYVLVL